METVKLDISSKEEAPRVELLFRIVYAIILGIAYYVLALVTGIVAVIQFFHILILGKRHATLNNVMVGVLKYEINFQTYILMTTDERPPVLPE